MKEFYTEFDELQEALNHVRINEPVMTYVNGRLVENEESYNKIQKLLDCEQMENCHKYLYDLDVEDLDDTDIAKIDKLFDIGVKRGLIDNTFTDDSKNADAADGELETPTSVTVVQGTASTPVSGSFTVLYSATKNGQTKCGECYSTAASQSAAKADCLEKLSKFGYENVTVLAIEASDGCDCDCGCQACDCTNNDVAESSSSNPYASGLKLSNFNTKQMVNEDDEEDDDAGDSDAGSEEPADDTAADDDAGTEEEPADDTADDDAGTEEPVDDDSADTDDKEADDGDADEDEGSDDDSDDEGSDDDSDDKESDDDSDDDSDSDDANDDEELDDATKANLRDDYRRVFTQVMKSCSFIDKSFNDLTIDEKVTFFKKLGEMWEKNEPTAFMTPEEQDQLESVVVQED